MPKLKTIPAPETVWHLPVDDKPSPQLMAEIRSTLNALDAAGAQHVTDYWIQELHLVSCRPNLKRWTDGALALIQRDLKQLTALLPPPPPPD